MRHQKETNYDDSEERPTKKVGRYLQNDKRRQTCGNRLSRQAEEMLARNVVHCNIPSAPAYGVFISQLILLPEFAVTM